MKFKYFGAALLASALYASATRAAVVDVDNLLNVSSFTQGASGLGAQSHVSPAFSRAGVALQTWTVGPSGRLSEIDIYGEADGYESGDQINFTYPPFTVTLSVLGGGTVTSPGDTLLGRVTTTSTDIANLGVTSFDLTSLDIQAAAGEVLTFQMSVEGCPQVTLCDQEWTSWDSFNGIGNTDGYAGGMAFTRTQTGLNPDPDRDLNFRTWMAAVPEPASWALMIAGFGFAGAALRRRRPLAPVDRSPQPTGTASTLVVAEPSSRIAAT